MVSIKLIKLKIKNVMNIQKITQSMKMVSASKFYKQERTLKSVKPFGMGTSNFYKSNFKEPKVPVTSDMFLVVTSDRGLCGSTHSNVCRFAIKEIENKKPEKENLRIICIGDKARSILRFRYAKNITLVVTDVSKTTPQYLDASKIFNELKKLKFLYGQIFYNEYISRVSYKTGFLSMYDLAAVQLFANLDVFDDIDYEDLQSYMEFSTTSLLFYILLQSSCSEQSSRMMAMDTASKNCSLMVNKLTITFNRVRQSHITQELIEIISGASVVDK